MTKIAFVADVHLGNHRRHGGESDRGLNVRCRQALATLEKAVELALEQHCSGIVVVGDLFDSVRPEPQLMAEAQRIFGLASNGTCRVVLIAGNHDKVSNQPEDHALGAMAPSVYRVVDEPTTETFRSGKNGEDIVHVYCVPHVTGEDARAWVSIGLKAAAYTQDAVLADLSGIYLLAAYVGVFDDASPVYLRNDREAVHAAWLCEMAGKNGITAVFCGNYHKQGDWKMLDAIDGGYTPAIVYQCGALVPTGWSDAGTGYGSVLVFDSSDRSMTRFEVPGPRFLAGKSPLDVLHDLQDEKAAGSQVYVQLTVPPKELDAASKWLMGGDAFAGEVLADDSEAHAALQQASASARAQETLDSSLDGYVAAMPLSDGVKRDEVLAKCRQYLKGGA